MNCLGCSAAKQAGWPGRGRGCVCWLSANTEEASRAQPCMYLTWDAHCGQSVVACQSCDTYDAKPVILRVQSFARNENKYISQYHNSPKAQPCRTTGFAKTKDTAHRMARTCLYLLEASTAPAPGQLRGVHFWQIAAPPQRRRAATS